LAVDQQYSGWQAGQLETSTNRGLTGDDNDQRDISTVPSLSSMSTSSINVVGQQDTAFCGSGRIGSIASASSLSRSNPPIILQLLWLCLILIIFLPANTLCCNLISWYSTRYLRLIAFSLAFSDAFNPRRILEYLCTIFGPRSVGISRYGVEQYFLFISGMSERTITKCCYRGCWWWKSWRKCSNRHFRWKFRLKVEHNSRTRFRVQLHVLDEGTIVSENHCVKLTNCRLQKFPILLHRFTRTLSFRLVIITYSRISKRTTKSHELKKNGCIGDHAGNRTIIIIYGRSFFTVKMLRPSRFLTCS